MYNTELWDKMKTVPQKAQKQIKGGRLNGMTDISPQWRYYVMTETFGPVGIGWKYTIDRQWVEPGADGNICVFCNVSIYVKLENASGWSEAIPGTGGSMLVSKERNGLHTSDEANKMALTDALSVAMKMLGVGALIYSGGNDYTKYTSPKEDPSFELKPEPIPPQKKAESFIAIINDAPSMKELAEWYKSKWPEIKVLPEDIRNGIIKAKDIKKAEFEKTGSEVI